MIELPDGWTWMRTREMGDGRTVVLAERMQPVDLGPRKRNLFDQYTTFRLGPDETVAGPIRWDRQTAEVDYSAD